MNLVKLDSFRFDDIKRRIIKILRYGGSDVQTAKESSPFGFDSGPLKDMIAVYSPTVQKGEKVVIGYIKANQLAAPGEVRIFSTDETGTVKTTIWLRSNGNIEIGGNTDWMVRYSKLEEAFNDLQNKWNTFAAAYVPGSPSVTGTPPMAEQSNADISLAKIDTVRTS